LLRYGRTLVLVKKYGNRRLYDTEQSRYVTLEQVGEIVRAGKEVRVVDAKSGEDLTAAALAQIIIEGRGAARLLPVPLLVQLIRMGDDALAEFLGQYVTWALEVYLQVRQGAQAISPFNPFLSSPFAGGLSRMFGMGPAAHGEPVSRPPAAAPATGGDLAMLRREIDELKKSMKKKRR
jgi:polyhydroxyalkanoate synthesis repressor PhaR